MKIFYVSWNDCIHDQHFVIINANTERQAEKIFDKWREDHPEEAPFAYSPRKITIKEGSCVHLNKER